VGVVWAWCSVGGVGWVAHGVCGVVWAWCGAGGVGRGVDAAW
jgi:hypothetical protein